MAMSGSDSSKLRDSKMIDEQLVFAYGSDNGKGTLNRLRELNQPRDIRTPSVTSVIAAYMRSRGDDALAELFEQAVGCILDAALPDDASDALADLVAEYSGCDAASAQTVKDAADYLASVMGKPFTSTLAESSRLTALQRRLLSVMIKHRKRVSFNELRDAWTDDVQDDTISRTLKRLRKKLPRSQWDFEISESNYEIIWHKKGQAVP